MRRDANGLTMIGASMVIIAVVIGLLVQQEIETLRSQIRAQGIALASSLSRVSLDRLSPAGSELGLLPLVAASQSSTGLAYAVVVDVSGEPLASFSTSRHEPPHAAIPPDPSRWADERLVELGEPPLRVREFSAPILDRGELRAQVRMGYWEPGIGVLYQDVSFHAKIALLVFLLIPLAYLWLRREIRPLLRVANDLPRSEDQTAYAPDERTAPSDLIADVIDRFRDFTDEMEEKVESMQRERMALLASSKVLAHQKNRIEIAFEALPDAVVAFDETGKLTVVNQRAEALLHRTREQLIGSSAAVWSPDPDVTQLVGRYVGGSGRLQRSESVEYAPDETGNRRVRASVHPLQEGHCAALVLRDVSLEWSARRTQAEFLAHMAHELKAPLNVMGMYSESLLGPDAKDERFRIDACNVIRDEIDRLNGLINNIFSIGRIESGVVSLDRQRVRTRELLADVFESTSHEGGSQGLDFALEVPDAMRPIFVDKALFSVAIRNLLTNAIKYNREGGRVTLAAEEDDAGLRIRVSDTGVGIPEEDLGHVFEKFYRSEDESVRKVSGHGLGLALVQEIVALHGGEIQLTSELGQGSEFALVFSQHAAIFREES